MENEMIISYSEVLKYQTCQRQYYYRYTLNRTPLTLSDALDTGIKGHKFLQDFYTYLSNGCGKKEAKELTLEKVKKEVNLGLGITDFALLKAWTLVDNYINETDFTSEAVIIENRFIIPASRLTDDPYFDDIEIGFTPDVVFKRKGGKHDLEDAKFVQRAWTQSKIDHCPQVKLYGIFLKKMNYDISRCIIRFFNIKTAKITIDSKTPTKIEEDILIKDFLAGVREVSDFRRKTDEEKSLAARTMNYTTCQYCPFSYPCLLEGEGKDASRTLKTQFETGKYDYNT